jgi:branched-chain amino acid transport system ATP-binding protein
MLELRSVSASYGGVRAVRGLSFSVQDGATVALIGRNGAGKTTTLRVIAGQMQVDEGEVRWNGSALDGIPPERRISEGIVLVPEGRGIFPELTVDENLRVGAFWWRPRPAELRYDMERVFELLPGLAERRRRMAGTMSGGEQQLLAIGRALMSRPKLLLLDEPSLGLSPRAVDNVYDVLRNLKSDGVGFVLVEQYVPLALDLCDYAIGLKKGVAVMSGPSVEIAQAELTDVYMAGAELEAEAKAILRT